MRRGASYLFAFILILLSGAVIFAGDMGKRQFPTDGECDADITKSQLTTTHGETVKINKDLALRYIRNVTMDNNVNVDPHLHTNPMKYSQTPNPKP